MDGDSETGAKQAQLQTEGEGEGQGGGRRRKGLEEEELGCRRREDKGEEGKEGEGVREGGREGGEDREKGERPLRLFIMMPVAASVSCVGSRLYFMFYNPPSCVWAGDNYIEKCIICRRFFCGNGNVWWNIFLMATNAFSKELPGRCQ